jgi:hypothetical protein
MVRIMNSLNCQIIFIYSNRVLIIVSLFLKLKLFSYENCLENYHVDIQTTVHLWNDLIKLSEIMIKTDSSKFSFF